MSFANTAEHINIVLANIRARLFRINIPVSNVSYPVQRSLVPLEVHIRSDLNLAFLVDLEEWRARFVPDEAEVHLIERSLENGKE